MNGTRINYIAGPRAVPSVGWGKFYPQDLSPDSQPNIDEWGPDNYWTPQAYIDWFNMNLQAYGEEVAIHKMQIALESWSGLGGAELDYCYDPAFSAFFAQYGLDVRTHACSSVEFIQDVVTDIADVITDTSQTVSNISSILTWLIPITLVGGTIWIVRSGTAQKYVKRKLAV